MKNTNNLNINGSVEYNFIKTQNGINIKNTESRLNTENTVDTARGLECGVEDEDYRGGGIFNDKECQLEESQYNNKKEEQLKKSSYNKEQKDQLKEFIYITNFTNTTSLSDNSNLNTNKHQDFPSQNNPTLNSNLNKNLNKNKKKIAFSLIELSIVLIIIGLLVAGITGGASLIKSAKMRSSMNEVQNMKTGIYSYYAATGKLPAIDDSSGMMEASKSCEGWKAMAEEGILDVKIDSCLDSYPIKYNNSSHLYPIPDEDFQNKVGIKSKSDSGYFVLGNRDHGDGYRKKNFLGLLINKTTNSLGTDILLNELKFNYTLGLFNAKVIESIDKKIDDGISYSGNVLSAFVELCRYPNPVVREKENCSIFFGLDL